MSKSKLCLVAVFLTLPIQLSKFFFPNYSYILGIPIDYRAISIYLIDIAVITYIIIFLLENAKNLKKIVKLQKNYLIALSIFDVYLFLNSYFFSTSQQASLVFTTKIFLFSFTSIFAAFQLAEKKLFKKIVLALSFSALWQIILAALQFMFQKTIGLWFLGERSFDSTTTAIAHTDLFGAQYLRPYGTFPHPNVMGAFFAIIFIITFFYLKDTTGRKRQNAKTKRYDLFLIALPALGVILSFSKGSLLVLVAAFLIYRRNIKDLLLAILLLPVVIYFAIHFSPDVQIPTIAERLTLIQASFNITHTNPIFGIGSNNFILALSKLDLRSLSDTRLLQPVHNVFLLILTENGIIGLLFFAGVLLAVSRNINNNLKLSLFLALLIFASVDHFLWTLEQGQLLFFLTIAIINTKTPV